MRTARVYSLKSLWDCCHTTSAQINGKWVPARPMTLQGFMLTRRLRHAWLAFTGKCDLIQWPEGQ